MIRSYWTKSCKTHIYVYCAADANPFLHTIRRKRDEIDMTVLYFRSIYTFEPQAQPASKITSMIF